MKINLVAAFVLLIMSLCSLSMPAFAAGANSSKSSNPAFSCGGTEPFWNLSVEKGQVKFDLLDQPPVSIKVGKATSATNYQLDYFRIYKSVSDEPNATLIIQKQSCSDGMSDKKYDYQSILMLDNAAYLGCCSKN